MTIDVHKELDVYSLQQNNAANRFSELPFKLIQISILILPLNWLLGTSLPWLFVVSLVLAIGLIRLSVPEWIIMCLAGALGISLMISGLDNFDARRFAAAIYNICIMMAFLVFINWGHQTGQSAETDRYRHLKQSIYASAFIAYLFYALMIFGTKLYVTITGTSTIAFKALLLGNLGNFPGIIGQYASNTIVDYDWINEATQLRIHGFGVYATESSIQFAILALLASIYLVKCGRPGLAILIDFTIFFALLQIGSRTAGLAYLFSVLLLGAVWQRGMLYSVLIFGPVVIAILVMFGPDLWMGLHDSFQAVANARAGSTESRVQTYTLAYDMVVKNNILLGLGIKPFNPYLPGMPVGSHSSIVSLFTKGGLLALSLYLVFYILLLSRIIVVQLSLHFANIRLAWSDRYELVTLSRIVLIWLIWTLTEDFDAPIYQAMLAGLSIGLFWNRARALSRHYGA